MDEYKFTVRDALDVAQKAFAKNGEFGVVMRVNGHWYTTLSAEWAAKLFDKFRPVTVIGVPECSPLVSMLPKTAESAPSTLLGTDVALMPLHVLILGKLVERRDARKFLFGPWAFEYVKAPTELPPTMRGSVARMADAQPPDDRLQVVLTHEYWGGVFSELVHRSVSMTEDKDVGLVFAMISMLVDSCNISEELRAAVVKSSEVDVQHG